LVDFIAEMEPTAVLFWMAHRQADVVSPGVCTNGSSVSLSLSQLYAQAAEYDFFEEIGGVADTTLFGDASNTLDEQGIPSASVLISFFDDIDWEENLAGTLAVLNDYISPSRAVFTSNSTSTSSTVKTGGRRAKSRP